MNIRPIHTTDDLNAAIAEVERLWGAPEGSDDGDKLDILSTLIDVYEREHFPLNPRLHLRSCSTPSPTWGVLRRNLPICSDRAPALRKS